MRRKSFTKRDSRNIKDELLSMVPALTDNWTDFHQSDPGVVLIDLMSYLADQQSYHIDRMALESFFTKAVERKNVFSGVRALGYTMHGYYSAETLVQVRSSHSHDIYINQYDLFSTEGDDGEEFYFSVKEDVVVPPNLNVLTEVPLIQGIKREFSFEYDDIDEFNCIRIPNERIADNSIRLIINDTEWGKVQDSLFHKEIEEVFSVEYSREGLPMIRLVKDWDTLITNPEDVEIEVIGLESDGADGNIGSGTIIKIISELEDSVGNTDCTSTISDIIHRDSISGGLDPETIEEAKVNAPKRIRTLWSVVTLPDYEDYLESHPYVDRCLALDWSISNSSIEEPYLVKLIIVPKDSDELSKPVRDQLYRELMERRVSPVKIEISGPKFVEIDFDIKLYVRPDYEQTDYIRVKALDELGKYFDPNSRDFGEGIRPAAIRYYLESELEDVLLADLDKPTENMVLNMEEFPSLGEVNIDIVKEEF